MLRTSSMEFDSSRLQRICALIAGNTCIFHQDLSLDALGAFCARAEVTEIHIGTYKLASLLRGNPGRQSMLPSFTRVLAGGSRVPGALRDAVRRHLTGNLWVHYATSEVGAISIAKPEEHEAYPEGVGLPLPGVSVALVDAAGNEIGDGAVGELKVRKTGMPTGYLDSAHRSRAFSDGWFHTGDLLSRDAGGPLIFHGRADDMMILNGINIFPAAIEDLLESLPGVLEAAAFPGSRGFMDRSRWRRLFFTPKPGRRERRRCSMSAARCSASALRVRSSSSAKSRETLRESHFVECLVERLSLRHPR